MLNSDLVMSSLKMGTRTPVLSIVPGAQEEPGEMLFIDMEPLAVYSWTAPEVTVREIFFFLCIPLRMIKCGIWTPFPLSLFFFAFILLKK